MKKFHTLFKRPKWTELALLLGFYLLGAVAYYLTLWINGSDYTTEQRVFWDVMRFVRSSGLQYGLYLLATLPIWFLIFRIMRQSPLWLRLSVHLLGLPIFTYGTQQAYYAIADANSWGHLTGSGQVWDLYIPALLYIIQFTAFHAYEYFRENQRKLRLEAELRQANLKSELSAIKAQLNPHFLYNVFNTINASIPAEHEKTRHLIGELSDLFRYQLKASREELVPLAEELDFVKTYLDLEKARFEERLQLKFDVEAGLEGEMIPPMLLQPLVENAVKHGLSPLIEGGEIEIRIWREGQRLCFEIADNGVGIDWESASLDRGIGLSNTRLRLKKMYQSDLQLRANTPRGLKVSFSL